MKRIIFLLILFFWAGNLFAEEDTLYLVADIRMEADYILACQWLQEDAGYGAINNIYPASEPDYIWPRENAMAILGLIEAADFLTDNSYIDKANLAMDYLIRVQEYDGSWCNQYSYGTSVNPDKSPTQTAEVMIAMYKLGYREDRYQSMKNAAEYLLACKTNGYQGMLVCGGKEGSGGVFSDWNWVSDNSYSYLALKAAYGWAIVQGDADFAQTCQLAAGQILNGIDLFYHGPEWYQVVDNNGNQFNNGNFDWVNYAPQFLDVPASGTGNISLGEWIHNTFQLGNGGCIGPDTDKQYPGLSFQVSFCWLDLGQNDYAGSAINWAETSGLWQAVEDGNGIKGGWIDWMSVTHPETTANWWERFIDTSFYSIAAWLGGYDFSFVDNAPPVLDPIGRKYIRTGSSLTFEISAIDSDSSALIYSAENLPAGSSFDEQTHVFNWTPRFTGDFVVRFKVGDGYLIDYEDVVIMVFSTNPCFLSGTPILMNDGVQKPIEEIKILDKILAYDAETNKLVTDTVKEVFVHDTDNYLIVNNELKVTANHPVFSDGKWVEIGTLGIGDSLLFKNGKYKEIKSIKTVKENVKVYNFEVNPYHTYIANGYVVHNRKLPIKVEQFDSGN